MSLETLARPYAQAIFDHSEGWGKDLDQMESVIKDPKVQNLISSPDLAYKQKTEAFIALFAGEAEEKTIRFISDNSECLFGLNVSGYSSYYYFAFI